MRAKTAGWRDGQKWVTLWHVSPHRLTSLRGRSTFMGHSGLYVSPSYSSLILDWCPVVMHRRGKKHPFHDFRKHACDMWDALSEKEGRTPEEDKEMAKWSAIMDRQCELDTPYTRIYIHELHCPLSLFEKASKFFQDAYDAGVANGAQANWGFWCWGQQIFMLNADIPLIQIHRVTELNRSEFKSEYDNEIRVNRYRNHHFFKQMETS